MKKIMAMLMALSVLLCTAGCGKKENTDNTTAGAETSAEAPTSQPAITEETKSGKIEVEKELFDVVITLPADMVGETTQEKLDAELDQNRMHSATLNSDGSVTYEMSRRQHRALMEELSAQMKDSFQKMAGSKDYPNWTKVEYNEDFTHFKVTTTSKELSLPESMSVLGFYMSGGMYQVFAGNDAQDIAVDFVNADSGEIISSANSADMGK